MAKTKPSTARWGPEVAGIAGNRQKLQTAAGGGFDSIRGFPTKSWKTKVAGVLGGRRRSSGDRWHAGWWPESPEIGGSRKIAKPEKRELGGEERERGRVGFRKWKPTRGNFVFLTKIYHEQ